MKVKYKTNKYNVSFCNKIKILYYKTYLLAVRGIRYFKHFLTQRNILFFVFLTIIWFIITTILNALGNSLLCYDIENYYFDILLAYITSVIITLFIGLYNQAEKYHTALKRQYEISININHTFDEIFKPFLNKIIYHYMPFYNQTCLDDSLNKSIDKITPIGSEFIVTLETILESIKMLKTEKLDGFILDNGILDININEAEHELRTLIFEINNGIFNWEQFEKTTSELMYIIDSLKSPWRKDLKIDAAILNILLDKNDHTLLEDFYLRLWIFDIDTIISYVEETLGPI